MRAIQAFAAAMLVLMLGAGVWVVFITLPTARAAIEGERQDIDALSKDIDALADQIARALRDPA